MDRRLFCTAAAKDGAGMDFKTYVQSVVASYVEKDDQNVIFIKHYNTIDISKEEILSDVEDTGNKVFLYHEYKMHDMPEAFAPFLGWIRYCYEKFYKESVSAADFLREAHVNPMHIEPLSCFITDGICTRKEDVLNFEIAFETERILQDLTGVFEYISRKHYLIMMLSKFHLAPLSTIQFFKILMQKKINIHAIVMYNDEFNVLSYKKSVWDDLMQKADDQNLQLEWGSLDSERTMDVQDAFWYDNSKKDEYLIKIINMYHTFALQDAYYYMGDILYRIDEKTINLTKHEQIPFLQYAAMIDMNLKRVNNALVLCDKMRDLFINEKHEPYLNFIYYYLSARARLILSQGKEVERLCKKCVSIAKQMGDEYLVCKSEILLWLSYCGICKDIFEYNFCNEIDMDVLEKAKRFGFTNFLAYLYVFGFENDPEDVRAVALGEKEPYYFNLGIEIGTKLENDNFLLNAYMKNIILYSRAGYYNYVRKMYKKRLSVLRRPNPLRESHMLAGLGYNSIILEDYKKANEYLKQSVCTLTELEQPDDVANSMYNLMMNYFVAGSYENTIITIDIILKMMREMGYQNIRTCSNVKLYSLMAISCYYTKEYYNSYYYLSKIEVIVEHMIRVLLDTNKGVWDEDLTLYHILKAMLYNHEDKTELSIKEFELAGKYLKNATVSHFFTYPLYALEQAQLYNKIGEKEKAEAEAIIRDAIEFCGKEDLNKKKAKLEYYLEHGERDTESDLPETVDLPIKHMFQIARQAGAQIKLRKKEDDIKFLTALQETISRENMTPEDLYQNTAAVLKNSYNLDEIVILRRKDGERYIMYDGENCPVDYDQSDELFDFFKEYKQAFLTNRTDKNFTQFMPVMKYFDEETIMTMIGIPIMEQTGTETVFLASVRINRRTIDGRFLLSGDDLMILKFAFGQYCEMMRRIDNRLMIENMNHKLEQSAITDHLTGITNRSGFSKQVERVIALDSHISNVILYLDLDNFKYYNDTFGHEIGDLVLVCFAEMFKKMTGSKGLPVRYGGDEFIILLYDQTEDDAVVLAQNIYKEIQDGFRDEIRRKLGKPIEIPENKKISCSIGIAAFYGGSKESFEKALNQADQMLYYVKRHGKSTFKTFS